MYLDKENLFSEDQAILGTANSTNVIDLGAAELGPGEPVDLFAQVTTVLDSAGEAATLAVALQTDSDEAFGSPTTIYTTPAIAEAALVAGYQFSFGHLGRNLERYLRLVYTVAGENFTSGKIMAGLIKDRQSADVL